MSKRNGRNAVAAPQRFRKDMLLGTNQHEKRKGQPLDDGVNNGLKVGSKLVEIHPKTVGVGGGSVKLLVILSSGTKEFYTHVFPQLRMFSMLYTIAVILLVLWLVGWLGFHLLGGFIHILIILAVIAFVMQLLKKG